MSEAALIAAIGRELTRRGAWWINVHGSGFGRTGVPDFVFIHHGQGGVLEAKSARGRPTPKQLHEITCARRAGAIGAVVRDIEEVRDLLNAIEHRAKEGSTVRIVYVIQAGDQGPVKIDTADFATFTDHHAALQAGNPAPLHVRAMFTGGEIVARALQRRFNAQQLTAGNWFTPSVLDALPDDLERVTQVPT